MFELEIKSSIDSYKVLISSEPADLGEYDFVIADEFFAGSITHQNVFWVPANENNKTLGTVEKICASMRSAGLNRSSVVVAVGGGVIQDLATLACSIYMRGVAWDYLPTTLTGMLDSCIGGKSSINVGVAKNLVGNVYPPRRVLVHTPYAKSLPLIHQVAGVAEAVKICYAKGEKSFETFVQLSEPFFVDQKLDVNLLAELTHLSLGSKQWFVEIDEFDKKERQLLNFGHTFGHALEAATGFALPHGIAVAIGMLAAVRHPDSESSDLALSLESYASKLLSVRGAGFQGIDVSNLDWQVYDAALLSDKKNSSGTICHILLDGSGALVKRCVPLEQGAVEKARAALDEALEQIQ